MNMQIQLKLNNLNGQYDKIRPLTSKPPLKPQNQYFQYKNIIQSKQINLPSINNISRSRQTSLNTSKDNFRPKCNTSLNSQKSSNSKENQNQINYPNIKKSTSAYQKHQPLSTIQKSNSIKNNNNKSFQSKKEQNNNTQSSRIIQSISKIPHITAKSWVVFDVDNGKFLHGKHPHKKREIASLTKIMTCYTTILFFEKVIKKDMQKVYFKVSFRASQIIGTSAKLKENTIISIWDLLHGLMLPSGNDSAVCLAETVGLLMYLKLNKNEEILNDVILYDYQLLQEKINAFQQKNDCFFDSVQVFVAEMNKNAISLNLKNTNFTNPHGLRNIFNKSTAYDIAKLSYNALKINTFQEIVNKKQHLTSLQVYNKQSLLYEYIPVQWVNSNKLLDFTGWGGIKTGITESAGPCLASYVNNENQHFIIVVLCSKSLNIRWTECQKIADWAKENYKQLQNQIQ